MRYRQGGGLTPADQKQRELVRLEAAARFERGETNPRVARELRVGVRQVEKWRQAWRTGGVAALGSKGPMSRPRLDDEAFARLETELRRGPAAHGWDEDQRWTLARVQTLVWLLFQVSYSISGLWTLLRRHGWSWQVPVRRANERDDGAIEVWKQEVWPQVTVTAAERGAWIVFEDEAGQGLRPPKGHTWGRAGVTPVVRVPGRGSGRVSVAGLVCYRPGYKSRLMFRTHVYRGRKGERKSFDWSQYRDLVVAAHNQLDAPIVLVWDNLNVHKTSGMKEFIDEHADWLTVFHLPAYAPELNPTEGIWSQLKGSMVNFAATSLDHLTQTMRHRLKMIQYRPHLIDGCLTETGLIMTPP